jgi:hypothetical protein
MGQTYNFALTESLVGGLGGGGAGGGGGGPYIYSRFQVVTAQSLPASAWSAALAWDDPAKNLDPEGILETSAYKTFTIPTDCILEVFVATTTNTGGTSDTEYRWQAVDPADGTTPILIPAQEGKSTFMDFMAHVLGPGSVCEGHWIGFCASGTAFQLRSWHIGGGANCHTDGRMHVQMTIWPV